MTDLDAQIRLADLRSRVLANEERRKRGEPIEVIPEHEYRLLILDLRRGRDMTAAQSASTKARARRALASPRQSAPIDLDQIFPGQLGDQP